MDKNIDDIIRELGWKILMFCPTSSKLMKEKTDEAQMLITDLLKIELGKASKRAAEVLMHDGPFPNRQILCDTLNQAIIDYKIISPIA